ncbi:hypothetical protein EV644_113159 [Kribbella orskensis]|uniref:Uncharacterized protein n=1 Tax=Kribbella orskensis TaxID=2512216 RepID=A0ABY2BH56_9ACTN|nr:MULTISPECIES: hypothetical protein [Kribbella]TCN36690.1 hypothetical protein EV642_114158 [Kribbella sp. VKM Ac-2500]TCO17929.1 hypothetical protein EV644_113159 [Kribbella orskensis]
MEPARFEPDPSPVAARDDRIAGFRAARRVIERGVPPLASSVDGHRFEFQSSLDGLALQAGGYVGLETGGAGPPTFQQGHALVAGKVMPHAGYVRFSSRTAEEGGADVPTSWAAFR